jgi:cytochrome c-type protein NapC
MVDSTTPDGRGNIMSRLWAMLRRPTVRFSLGALLLTGFIAGVLFWGGYNWSMKLSNTETFCISCHEMKDNVYQELKETIHYSNRSGVRATCSDCHVPREWHHKFVRKIQASNELFHKVMGTLDTREKFEAKRLELAKHVWASMKANDSRECRNCHNLEWMKPEMQSRPARKKHAKSKETGETCIDCHQGIAHKLPEGWDDQG